MSNHDNHNHAVIEEFRANAGLLGGPFTGRPTLLLNTIGAKSGLPRTTPLAYTRDGERIVVIASNSGSATHPAWYHNLIANPEVMVELGAEQFQARAIALTEGDERARLYGAMAALLPFFADFERKTDRKIPVVVLERLG